MIWSDTVNTLESGDESLPHFDDANTTPVKMRMKKSNGNVVDVDILTTFLMEKLDADTLNKLMSATSPISLSVNDGKVVIGVDGPIDATAIVFNDKSAYADILAAIFENKCMYYVSGVLFYSFAGQDGNSNLLFLCGNRQLVIDTKGNRTYTTNAYTKTVNYGATISDFDINSYYVCNWNEHLLTQYEPRVPSFIGIVGTKYVRTWYNNGTWNETINSLSDDPQVLVIGVNSTEYSLDDLYGYDVVIARGGGVDHFLTQRTSTKAVFTCNYLVGSEVCTRTFEYDGTTWTQVDSGSPYRVKVNVTSEPQYLFNALVEGNGIRITGGDTSTMTISSKTKILTWRQTYAVSELDKYDVLICLKDSEYYPLVSKKDGVWSFAKSNGSTTTTLAFDGEVWADEVITTIGLTTKDVSGETVICFE